MLRNLLCGQRKTYILGIFFSKSGYYNWFKYWIWQQNLDLKQNKKQQWDIFKKWDIVHVGPFTEKGGNTPFTRTKKNTDHKLDSYLDWEILFRVHVTFHLDRDPDNFNPDII